MTQLASRSDVQVPSRTRWALGAAVAAVALLVALGVLGVTGELREIVPAVFDPGAAVRYGVPAARVVHDLSAALTVGLLVLAAWFVAPEPGTAAGSISGVRRVLVRYGLAASVAWAASALVGMVLTAADVTGVPLGSPGFSGLVLSFLLQVDLGRALGVSLLVVVVVANLLVMATRVTTVAWAAALSLAALLPLALGGHAAGSRDHMNSVDSLALHLVGVCLWVGGLAALLLVAGRLGPQLPVVVRRYSTLAGACFAVVSLSGVVNAWLRLGSLSRLGTTYGLLVIGKAVGLVLLGVAGWAHRRFLLARLEGDRRWFLRLASVELLVMGATMGLAVALSRSAPPTTTEEEDPVAALLGYPAPPPLTLHRYLTEFYPDVLWLSVALVLAGAYVAGVVRLWRRGDRWPVHRTAFWLAGSAVLVFVTSGGPALYGRLSFSSHMIQHMSLMTVVPLLLVFGAPVTLAMRTLVKRTDGSFGPRETLMQLIHSRFTRVLGHPVVAAVLLIASLIIFYYSRLFQLAMFTHTGHVLMTAHFLLTGYLFVWALVGVDPGPSRPPYPLRLMLLLVTLGFHAFFGISLMSSGSLLAPDWWHALGQNDDAALLSDQQTGGSIAWAAGDLPSLFIGLALIVGWFHSDAREAKRSDRQADRDGDAELRRYNEQLASLSRRDPQP
jgi:cytochrome c oxidase assembly factor CtaG/putative copper export protein